ncbi:LuxR C-terminal-related transcriptional regulator [Empedobacter falsenii]
MNKSDQKSLIEYTTIVKQLWSENTDCRNKEEKEDRFKWIEESLQAFASLSIGEYFMYVINPNSAVFEYVSPQAKSILGYHPTEYTAELCVKIVHPDDLEYVIDIQQKIANFNTEITPEERVNYKFMYNFRVIDKKGIIHQIHLQHFFYELSENLLPNRVFCLANDITQIKVGGIPTMQIYNIENGLSNLLHPKTDSSLLLTKKEKEIIEYLFRGYTSQDIADAIGLSKHTIDTHRRNILKKNHCSNTSELFSLYFKK